MHISFTLLLLKAWLKFTQNLLIKKNRKILKAEYKNWIIIWNSLVQLKKCKVKKNK